MKTAIILNYESGEVTIHHYDEDDIEVRMKILTKNILLYLN